MNNNNNNNISKEFNILDFLSLVSFIAQMKNMNDDEIAAIKNNSIIKAVANEIDKLHNENDDIINNLKIIDKDEQLLLQKLDEIIYLLRRL